VDISEDLPKESLAKKPRIPHKSDSWKSILIEFCSYYKFDLPVFIVINESGPPHDRTFEVECRVRHRNAFNSTRVSAKSKKAAETEASRVMYEAISYVEE